MKYMNKYMKKRFKRTANAKHWEITNLHVRKSFSKWMKGEAIEEVAQIMNLGSTQTIDGTSTASNIIECTHKWLLSATAGCSTDVVYIDFSRAFDSVVVQASTCSGLEKYWKIFNEVPLAEYLHRHTYLAARDFLRLILSLLRSEESVSI